MWSAHSWDGTRKGNVASTHHSALRLAMCQHYHFEGKQQSCISLGRLAVKVSENQGNPSGTIGSQ